MYKSVVREGKYLVLLVDGVFETPLMEFPTEELADKVAFELQTAWDQGESWGAYQMQKVLESEGGASETAETIKKMKAMSQSEQEVYLKKISQHHESVQKAQQARRWKSVLNWKKYDV